MIEMLSFLFAIVGLVFTFSLAVGLAAAAFCLTAMWVWGKFTK